MHRLILAAALAVLPVLSEAQSIIRPDAPTEKLLFSGFLNAAAAVATWCGGTVDQSVTVTAVSGYNHVASGGGAGLTTWRVSDGTNNCDCSMLCTATAGIGAQRSAPCAGSCSFAPRAALLLSVTVAGCTTTQPSFKNIGALGLTR